MGGLIELAGRPAPAVAPSPRSTVRARLAAAIDELAKADDELAAAHEPATRLAGVIAEAALLEAGLTATRAADEQRLGAWLAAGRRDHRPEPATVAAEQHRAALAGDAAAARTALPGAEQAFQRCAARVRELQNRRDEAVCGAAIDAAEDFSAAAYRAALTAALEHEAVLRGLRDELLRCGNRADAMPGALAAATRVAELIAETKHAAVVWHNPEAACRLLATLVADPDARLQKVGAE